jgi:hypothetical protein
MDLSLQVEGALSTPLDLRCPSQMEEEKVSQEDQALVSVMSGAKSEI